MMMAAFLQDTKEYPDRGVPKSEFSGSQKGGYNRGGEEKRGRKGDRA